MGNEEQYGWVLTDLGKEEVRRRREADPRKLTQNGLLLGLDLSPSYIANLEGRQGKSASLVNIKKVLAKLKMDENNTDYYEHRTSNKKVRERVHTTTIKRDPKGEIEFLEQFRKFAVEEPEGTYRDRCGLGPFSFPTHDIAYSDAEIARLTTQRGQEVERFVSRGGKVCFILTRLDLKDYRIDLKHYNIDTKHYAGKSIHTPRQIAARYQALLERLVKFADTDLVWAVASDEAAGSSEAIFGDRLVIRAVPNKRKQFYKKTYSYTEPTVINSIIDDFDEEFDELRDERSFSECKQEIIGILRRNLEDLGYSS